MKITYIEIEANAEELKTTNTVCDNFLGALNRCMEKARYGTAEPIEEEEVEEDI